MLCPMHRSAVLFGLLISGLAIGPTHALALDWRLESTDQGDIPAPNTGSEQTVDLVGDIDGDGRDDVVIAERTTGPSVVVYFREDGTWNREVVEEGALPIEAGGTLADVDGDGDLDIVLGGDWSSNEIWWWENPGSRPYLPTGWVRRTIKQSGDNKHHDMIFADFDGDGVQEFVFWNQGIQGLLCLAEIPADPHGTSPWIYTTIFTAPIDSEGLVAADINLDGKVDICGGGYWFEHTGGTNFTPHAIVADKSYTRMAASQIIPGGRPELIVSKGDALGPLLWSEWDGSAWVEHVLDATSDHAHSLAVGDIDHDGQTDIFVAEMHTPGAGANARNRVFLNRGGGVFEPETVSTGIGNHEAKLADLDGDGWLDIMGKPFAVGAPGLNAWLQVPPASDIFLAVAPCLVAGGSDSPAREVHAVDVNADGRQDVSVLVGGAAGEARIYQAPSWSMTVVTTDDLAAGAWTDVDHDGDLDLVAATTDSIPDLIWYANPDDGTGSWPGMVMRTLGARVGKIVVADLQNTGLTDIVVWGVAGIDRVFELAGGSWGIETVTSDAPGNGGWVADIDRDGAQDVGRAGRWWRNPAGVGSWTANDLSLDLGSNGASWALDLDRDGWTDVLTFNPTANGDLVYHPNDHQGGLQTGFSLVGMCLSTATDLAVADFDSDGDLDFVVSGLSCAGSPQVFVALSGGSVQAAWTVQSVAQATNVVVADFDRQGNPDLLLGNSLPAATPCNVGLAYNQLLVSSELGHWQRHVIDSARPWRAVFITAGDVDRDGFTDVIDGAWWYRNPGSPSGTWVRNEFGDPLKNMAAVGDFDRDGDLDVLGTEGIPWAGSDAFVWARNDGSGVFSILQNIPNGSGSFLQGTASGRFNYNAAASYQPQEVGLSWENGGGGLQMLTIPEHPASEPWSWRVLTPETLFEGIAASDIDRDGDLDLALGTLWVRNDNSVWTTFVIQDTAEEPDRVLTADINQDGREDVIVGFEEWPADMVWYEQPTDPTTTWLRHDIASLMGPMSLAVGDLDHDGDLDLVVGEHNRDFPDSASVYVYENRGGGLAWQAHLVYQGDEQHMGTQLLDVDNDGDLDIISHGWNHDQVLLYENLGTSGGMPGDLVAPTLVTAVATNGSLVSATFSEPVDVLTATDPSLYTIVPPVVVNSASLQADQQTVLLGVSPLSDGLSYSLSATGVRDLAQPANVSDGAVTVSFTYVVHHRATSGLLVLYDFQAGSGTVVSDVSDTGAPLDLVIANPTAVSWLPEGGLALEAATTVRSPGPATKVIDAVTASSEITVEAWLTPAAIAQNGPARIVTCSLDPSLRNFTLGQGVPGAGDSRYVGRLRTTATSLNGLPEIESAAGTATTELTHIVYTRNAAGGATIYLNGNVVQTSEITGTCANWDPSYSLALGNEPTNDRPWLGVYQLVAVYDRALAAAEIDENYLAGPPSPNLLLSPVPAPRTQEFVLYPNHPNPFNPMTTIALDVPYDTSASISVYDLQGHVIQELFTGRISRGHHTFTWRGRDNKGRSVADGLYFFRLESGGTVITRKMILVR